MTQRSSGNVGRLTNSEIVEIPHKASLIRIPLSILVPSPMLNKNLVARTSLRARLRVILSFAFLAFLIHAPVGRCDLILGNMSGGFNDSGAIAAFESSVGYSIGFTVGATPITISSVDFRLRTNMSPGLATLELRSDASGNPNSTALATFGNQTVGTGFSTINFTPTGVMQLTASTKYWFTLGTQITAPDGLIVGANNTSIAPTGPLATFDGLRSGFFNNQNFDPTQAPVNANIPTFAINGTITAVPEPSSFIQFALAYGVYEWYRRRSKRSRTLRA